MLIYALHRFFGELTEFRKGSGEFPVRRFWEPARRYAGRSDGTQTVLDLLVKDVAAVVSHGENASIELPTEITKWLESEIDTWGDGITRELLRCFGASSAAALVRKGREIRQGKVTIASPSADSNERSEQVFILGTDQSAFRPSVPGSVSIYSDDIVDSTLGLTLNEVCGLSGINRDQFLPVARVELLAYLMNRVTEYLVGGLRLPAFYLPADRTGVMHAHSAIVSAMLANAPMATLETSARTPLLSGVLTDFLRRLIEINAPALRRGQRARKPDAGTGIETSILEGAIGVERFELIDYPHFTYRPDRWKENLPLMRTSSMVSELAPVVLYLRYLVQPGNVLIIEEPESHLHPAMQVEFTRQLAKLVQAGYRVIITTHSEWILEELANVVQRSRLPPEELSTVSDSDAALTADQVGVWLFRPRARPKGSEVVHVPVGDSGLYDSGFDDVAIALSNDGANIFNRIGRNG